MIIRLPTCLVALTTCLLALSVQAHEQKDGMKQAQQPDCATIKGIDHFETSVEDSVMRAMIIKCSSAIRQNDVGARAGQVDDANHFGADKTQAPPEHRHVK